MKFIFYLCLLYCAIYNASSLVFFKDTIQGVVGGGNFTYYTLSKEGSVSIRLKTFEGDADLYVSDKTLQPTYDPEHYSLQSATCGIDKLDIPSSFGRPLAIAVYGHPFHEITTYEIEVLVDSSKTPEESAEIDDVFINEQNSHKPINYYEPEEEESLVWTIFVSILKVLLEVIAS